LTSSVAAIAYSILVVLAFCCPGNQYEKFTGSPALLINGRFSRTPESFRCFPMLFLWQKDSALNASINSSLVVILRDRLHWPSPLQDGLFITVSLPDLLRQTPSGKRDLVTRSKSSSPLSTLFPPEVSCLNEQGGTTRLHLPPACAATRGWRLSLSPSGDGR
jgi:hypothetical protein